jgi:hypothetical protein
MSKNVKRKLSLKKVTVATLEIATTAIPITDADLLMATTVTGQQVTLSHTSPICRFNIRK